MYPKKITGDVAPDMLPINRFKARLRAWIDRPIKNEEMIEQRRRNSQEVLMSFKEYQTSLTLRGRAKRAAAVAYLRRLAKEIQIQNNGLTASQADALADEITRNAVQGVLDKK